MDDRIELEKEYRELTEKLASGEFLASAKKGRGTNGAEIAHASRRLKEVQQELENLHASEERVTRRQEAKAVLENEEDPELRSIAEEDLAKLDAEERDASTTTLKKETAIIEIRPGTGGEEAALFAGDLARMYQRFAERKKWKVVALEKTPSELGGFKSLVLAIRGPGAMQLLGHEGGVHRVQRVPATEKAGRIHTSAATVAVMREAKPDELDIPAKDLRIDTMRASGPGGQLVNRRESAVRITHIPTGITATSQTARVQNANREQAMQLLLAKIAERKRREEAEKEGSRRKAQIGSGDRSEKIRTYNFPQDRVTDHRVGKTWHNIEKILDGDLEKIVSALQETR